MGGEVQVALLPPTIAVPQIKAGKVRALAFAGEKRWDLMPDLPTISETIPGLVIPAGWDGVFVPSGTPKEIIARLQREIVEAIKVPKVRDQLVSGGYIPDGDSTADFEKFFRSEIDRYGELVRKIGIKPM
jgi:tripartite-type tricarboxylate transporter receptor subunit TctC